MVSIYLTWYPWFLKYSLQICFNRLCLFKYLWRAKKWRSVLSILPCLSDISWISTFAARYVTAVRRHVNLKWVKTKNEIALSNPKSKYSQPYADTQNVKNITLVWHTSHGNNRMKTITSFDLETIDRINGYERYEPKWRKWTKWTWWTLRRSASIGKDRLWVSVNAVAQVVRLWYKYKVVTAVILTNVSYSTELHQNNDMKEPWPFYMCS
jgi:hypothetical protein